LYQFENIGIFVVRFYCLFCLLYLPLPNIHFCCNRRIHEI